MKDKWKETTLAKVVEVLSGSTPSTKEPTYWDGDIAWITPKDLSTYNSVFISRGERNITESGLNNSSAQLLPKNTILFSSRAPIGYVAIASNELTTNQGFKNIICDEKTSHYKFFYYWLKFSSNSIERLCSGSTFSEANATVMRSLPILLPPLSEQKAIAAVLSSFDDKIELLRRQNTTLEKIAQAIFKEWFVNFTVNGKKLKIDNSTGLPEGWRHTGLHKIADFLNGLALQKYPPQNEADALPVIKIRELKSGITEQTDKASKRIKPEYIVEDGDVLFSWSGSLEVVLWCHGKGALNQHLFKVTSQTYPKWFYYFWILEHLPFFKSVAHAKATTMGHIQRHHLAESLVAVPNADFLAFADNKIKPVFEHIVANNSQIQTLSKLRDLLLPKLMKGEIRVKDAETCELRYKC